MRDAATVEKLCLEDLADQSVLVMWSGGLDSTSLLFRALTESSARVHTHFVTVAEGPPEATPPARAAIRAQRAWLRENVRDWPHSESTPPSDGSLLEFPDDVLPHRFAHALVYLEHAARAAVDHGLEPGDFVLMGFSADCDPPIGSWPDRLVAQLRNRAISYAFRPGRPPAFTTLNPPPTRAEAQAALPNGLAALVTSCPSPVPDPRSPIGWSDCGECPDCRRTAVVRTLSARVMRSAGVN